MTNEIAEMIRNGECPCDICEYIEKSSMVEPCYTCSSDDHFKKFKEKTEMPYVD